MSRRLVLLRHGQTAWNLERRGQGHTDVELDDVGHEQAAVAGPWVARAFEPSVLWSSDLARARQTASYVAKESGLDPVLDVRLREFDLGERTGMLMDEYEAQFPQEYAAFQQGDFATVPGAEQPEHVAARVTPAVREVCASLEPGQTGVVVSHGSAIKVAVLSLLGLPLELRLLRGLTNCTVAVLEESSTGDQWRLAGYGVARA